MALTVLEEMQILDREIGPSVLLIDLVHQSAVGEGIEFNIGYKEFDGEANPEAQLYLDKILSVIGNVNRIDGRTIDSLFKLIVALIGNSSVTYQQVVDAEDSDWETFIADNMLRTFELFGRVLKSEKTAYDALP